MYYYSSVDPHGYSISGSAYSLYLEVFTIWRLADTLARKVELGVENFWGAYFFDSHLRPGKNYATA